MAAGKRWLTRITPWYSAFSLFPCSFVAYVSKFCKSQSENHLLKVDCSMILPVSDRHCRNTAARIGLLPKGFITADARTAISISEDRIMQDWTAVEQRKD